MTHLHVCIFDYPPQILNNAYPRGSSGMESRQGVRGEDDLIIMLNKEVEHVRYEDDECIGGAVDEGPRKLGFGGVGHGRLGGRGRHVDWVRVMMRMVGIFRSNRGQMLFLRLRSHIEVSVQIELGNLMLEELP